MMPPQILPYPKLPSTTELPELTNELAVYAVRRYPLTGYSIVVRRHQGEMTIRLGDFAGQVLDLAAQAKELGRSINGVVTLCLHARIPISQWYFAGPELLLVDVRKSPDVFLSPGLLRDLCGTAFRTQELLKLDRLGGLRDLREEVIIKPVKFRTVVRGEDVLPLYGIQKPC